MSVVTSEIVIRGRTLSSPVPKRILFYGACHANALARIFETFCTDFSYSFDTVTNYEIIHRDIPFPYESVANWDVIVFSPILRRKGYETSRLIEACIKNNVKYVCYPYLEWRGYFPYIKDGYFVNAPSWYYPSSIVLARNINDFNNYMQEFNRPFKEDNFLFENLESTTEILRNHEKMGQCDVTISDFIVEEFRNKRLFLIPSHPSQALWIEVVKRLNQLLKLPLDPAYLYSAAEPQDGVKVPIHPDVSERLGLRFQDADFQNKASHFGSRTIPWSDYMRLAYGFGRDSTMRQSISPTAIKRFLQSANTLSIDDCIKVPNNTILQARATPAEDPSHLKLDITWAEPKIRHQVMGWDNVYIFKPHWLETAIPAGD